MRIAGSLLIGGLSAAAIPASWDYVHFMAREGSPVLGVSFMWIFMPFVLPVDRLGHPQCMGHLGGRAGHRHRRGAAHMSSGLWVLVAILLAGLVLRMPIGFSMLAAGIGYLITKGQDVGLVAEQVGNGLYNSYVLLAVPLFVFAANIMNAGTVSERIFDFCRILVGRMRGGLAQVDILVSVIFSGMSGSAIADAAGPGLVTIRQMLKKPGYTRGFAGAVVVASATLGPIIPPSIPMVIYAMVSGASVGALFLGGVLPGFLMAAAMMVVVHLIAVKRNMPRDEPVPRSQWAGLVFRGALPLSMPIVLLGGIYSGAFTPTEAAAVAALHALILAAVVFRALTWRSFWGVVMESARGSAVITLILAGSFVLNYAFTAEGVPQGMAMWVDSMDLSKLQFFAAGEFDVSGAGLFSGCLGAAAGLRAHALARRQAAGRGSGALRCSRGAEHDDWPDHPTVRHAAVCHQSPDRHSDWRDDQRGLALPGDAAGTAAGHHLLSPNRAVAPADHGLRHRIENHATHSREHPASRCRPRHLAGPHLAARAARPQRRDGAQRHGDRHQRQLPHGA